MSRDASLRDNVTQDQATQPIALEPTITDRSQEDTSEDRNHDDSSKRAAARKKMHTQLVEVAGELLFGTESGLSIFQKYDSQRYDSQPENVFGLLPWDDYLVMHVLLDQMQVEIKLENKTEFTHTVPPVVKEFLEHLMIKRFELLAKPDLKGYRPLDVAAKQVKPVVFLVTDLVLSEDNLARLPDTACPAKLKPRSDDVCCLKLPGIIQSAFAKKTGDVSSDACLHETVEVRDLPTLCSEMNNSVRQALKPFEAGGAAKGARKKTILHRLLSLKSFKKTNSTFTAERFRHLIGLCSEEIFKTFDIKGYCPLHKAISHFQQDNLDFDRLYSVIDSLVQQCPASIYLECKEGDSGGSLARTPYAMLKTVEPAARSLEPAHQNKASNLSKALKLLQHTCVGHSWSDRDQKLTYLYGGLKDGMTATVFFSVLLFLLLLSARSVPQLSRRAVIIFLRCKPPDEVELEVATFHEHRALDQTLTYRAAPNIHFDMIFPSQMNREFTTDLKDAVRFRFDTVLEYVSIRHDGGPSSQPLCPSVFDNASQERDPYKDVFDWLASSKVEKIFHIIVEDLVPFPHTDEAIKQALKPFQVERWDWRKIDVSSETIFYAAPTVRELHLQSSGNEAVLRSWTGRNGLAKLDQLKSITISIHPNLREKKEVCEQYFANFKEDFRQLRPAVDISLKWADPSANQKRQKGDKESSSNSKDSRKMVWLQMMKPFIQFLKTIIKEHIEEMTPESPASVKIALIDDGVFPTGSKLPTLENGKSWYGQRDEKIPFRDYFAGPSIHGTQMAQCICQVCPMVKLYVARMDDSKPGLDKFTVDSAIKAIRWAIEMDVDVISMSWTFGKAKMEEEQRKSFEEAVQDAHKKGIIFFCSLNDKEMASAQDLYPIALSEVIRVGSATKRGRKAAWSVLSVGLRGPLLWRRLP